MKSKQKALGPVEVYMLPACRVRSLDRVGPLVILPALGALEQFREDAGIVVDV